jgi:hypothetical protein
VFIAMRVRNPSFTHVVRGGLSLVLACSGPRPEAKPQAQAHAEAHAEAHDRASATAPVIVAAATRDAVTVPVRAARAWTTALAPNARGGWNFITQTYEYESGAPTEFVVLDLASGKQTTSLGPPAIHANSNSATW